MTLFLQDWDASCDITDQGKLFGKLSDGLFPIDAGH
jgi:hypothetical protein